MSEKKIRPRIFFPFFLMGMLVAASICYSSICWSSDSRTQATFSLNAQDESLESVIRKISAATGYRIVVYGDYLKIPINVSVQAEQVIAGLSRVLQDYNHSLIEQKEGRRVNVLIFGKKGSLENSFSGFAGADKGQHLNKFSEENQENRSDRIIAENMDEYARKYLRQAAKKNRESIQTDNINDYARQYVQVMERNKKPKTVPIQSGSIDEYAAKYMKRSKEK